MACHKFYMNWKIVRSTFVRVFIKRILTLRIGLLLLALNLTSIFPNDVCGQAENPFYLVDTSDHYSLDSVVIGFLDSTLENYHKAPDDTSKLGALIKIQNNLSRNPISLKYGTLALGMVNKMLSGSDVENEKLYLRYKIRVLQGISWAHNNRGDLVKEIEVLQEMLQVNEVLRDSALWSSNLASLGIVYCYQQEFERSEKYIREGLTIAEGAGLEIATAELYMRLGYMYLMGRKLNEAIASLKKCLSFEQVEGMSPLLMAQAYDNIGAVYLRQKEYKQASIALHKAADYYKKIGGAMSRTLSLIGLASLEMELDNLDVAEEYGLEAYALTIEMNNPGNMRSILGILSRIYERKGAYKQAFEYYKQAERMSDSLANVQSIKKAIEKDMQMKHEKKIALDSIANAEAMKVQNALLRAEQAESKRTKNQRVFLVLGLFISIVFGFALFNRFKAVTKQKELVEKAKEELLQAHQKLEELDATKSRFFTNISHELRTPLTVIRGMATELKEHPDGIREREVDMIFRNTESLLQLVNQMLDLRKLESGELKVNYIQGDVIANIAYVFNSLESLAIGKELDMLFESTVSQVVMNYDESKLEAIVSNLVSNAIKYTPNRGRITCSVHEDEELNQLVLKVSDTGLGIPEHAVSKVFDRFYQVDEKERKAIEGTGIGLTLTKELVTLLGGVIEVESSDGKGSTFTVRLPIENRMSVLMPKIKAPSATPLQLDKEPITTSGVKLLIVEDNADVAAYLKMVLETSYDLSFAKDGQVGFDMAIENVPDLILSDVMMPLKSGFELCNDLKGNELTSHIPVVLLTARADMDSKITGLERGADAYLSKPIDKRELELVLKNLFESRLRMQERYAKVVISSEDENKESATPMEDAFLQKIWEAVDANLDDANFKVPQLCKYIGVSRSQLHQKVKALTGKSITHYVRGIKIARAKQLLLEENMNISEISYALGFAEPAYFSKVFQGETGKSPSDFRQD